MPTALPRTALIGARILAAAIVFSVSAVYEATHLSSFADNDVWWHLRTGMWILQNHSVPHSGILSQYPNLPWMATSWGFDALLAAGYSVLGLAAIPILLMGLKVALAVVTFRLARSVGANFWIAIGLSAATQFAIASLQPSPAVFSMLFFGIELMLILQSRRSGSIRVLFWLPALFFVWANLHIQFVCGLALAGLYLLCAWVEEILRASNVCWLDHSIRPIPLSKAAALIAASVLATFVTPYSYRVILDVQQAMYSDVAFQHFAEMRAMNFRSPQEFALMLLVMGAFLVLGRRRSLQTFEMSVLVLGTIVAFRIQRDSWLAMIPAVCFIGAGFQSRKHDDRSHNDVFPAGEKLLIAVLVATTLTFAGFRLRSQDFLMSQVSRLPARACDFISQNHLPEPLLNAYLWGGFLTWYMPQYPVVVDGRVDLYGDEILLHFLKVTGGSERLDADPQLAAARTLLLERQSAMAKALTDLPALNSQYRLVYSDELAAVFVRR